MSVSPATRHRGLLMNQAMTGALAPFAIDEFDANAFVGAVAALIAGVARQLPEKKRAKFMREVSRTARVALDASLEGESA